MKNICLAALAILTTQFLFTDPALAQSQSWKIDPKKSSVDFVVFREGSIGAQGSFTDISGEIHYDSKNMKTASVAAVIPLSTFHSGISTRDRDLTGPYYFNVARFSNATFKSRQITKVKTDEYKLSGDFQLHGVTKSVTLNIKEPRVIATNPTENTLQASGTTVVDERDYGLTLKLLHPDGFVVIDEKIRIKIKIVAQPLK